MNCPLISNGDVYHIKMAYHYFDVFLNDVTAWKFQVSLVVLGTVTEFENQSINVLMKIKLCECYFFLLEKQTN